MKVVGLISGGKDSCYALHLAAQHGYEVVALANLLPAESAPDELDSYMYQTDLLYTQTDGDEVEDLYQLLAFVKESMPQVTCVASGAIASDYQRLRVESVCARLGLVSLAYLWRMPQRMLLRGMIDSGIHAVLVKVAALGLDPRKHLGKTIAQMELLLHSLADNFGCNVCGEGGEYETLTLDCPMFKHGRIVLDKFEVVHQSADAVAPVGHLHPTAFHIQPKDEAVAAADLASDIRWVPEDWMPHHRHPAACRQSFNRRPGEYHVSVRCQEKPDYVQVCCRPAFRMPPVVWDCTESDTANALHEVLEALQQELTQRQLLLHHALFVHLYLANMGHFAAANAVYCKYFPGTNPPARACVQVPLPAGCPLLVDVLLSRHSFQAAAQQEGGSPAAAPAAPATQPAAPATQPAAPATQPAAPAAPLGTYVRRVLHVQSISHWAPSCIGPYSQANMHKGLVYMAGQIPLCPPTMALVPADVTGQTLRVLASAEAVAVAVRSSVAHAALSLTVYWVSSIGPAGCAAIKETVASILDWASGSSSGGGGGSGSSLARKAIAMAAADMMQQLPAVAGRAATAGGAGVGRGGAAAPAAAASAAAGGTAGGRDVTEAGPCDQEAGAAGAEDEAISDLRLEPYLEECRVRHKVCPNVVYVEVDSLPRGSLVEVQPLLLDVDWLQARARSTSDSDDDPGSSRIMANGNARANSGSTHASSSASDASSISMHARHNGTSLEAHLALEQQQLGTTISAAGPNHQHTPNSFAPAPFAMPLVANNNSSPAAGGVVAAAAETLPSANASGTSSNGSRLTAASAADSEPSDDVMVTSVCYRGRLLHSLFHLPASVFDGPDLCSRLLQAVKPVLYSYKMDGDCVVRAIAWYNVHRVSLRADLNQSSNTCSLHVTWVPVQRVCTSACQDCAAILEVLAQA